MGSEMCIRDSYTPDQFFSLPEEARTLAGQIFGCSTENIAIVPSASYGIQTAANILPVSAGQNILVLEDQFPSNIYPWQDRAAKVGARVSILPTPDTDDWTNVLRRNINKQTAIVAIPQTHWASGATIKLKDCLLYTSPSPRDLSTSRMPSSA